MMSDLGEWGEGQREEEMKSMKSVVGGRTIESGDYRSFSCI